ncbi:MAG: energy transducer TonB [Sporomusaceae bacterium]|nr:energy transducer TonB [Sporomusaceae bacterium]
MRQKKCWQKAFGLSLIIHAVIVLGIGYFSPLTEGKEPEESYVELALTDAPFEREFYPAASNAAAGGALSAAQATVAPTALPNNVASSAPAANDAPTVAATGSLSVLSTEGTVAGASGSSSSGTGEVQGTVSQGADSSETASASRGTGSGGGYSRPGVLERVLPRYPENLRRQGVEGTVILRIKIMTDGSPGDVTVSASSGHEELDEAAVAAVWRWRFTPSYDRGSGEPVVCTTSLPVRFSLH